MTGYDEVLGFWFEEISEASWWKKDPAFDQLIRDRFGALHASASRAELFAWRVAPRGRLAEVIILDQFSRNLYRDDARAFALDSMALALAQEAITPWAGFPPSRSRVFYSSRALRFSFFLLRSLTTVVGVALMYVLNFPIVVFGTGGF